LLSHAICKYVKFAQNGYDCMQKLGCNKVSKVVIDYSMFLVHSHLIHLLDFILHGGSFPFLFFCLLWALCLCICHSKTTHELVWNLCQNKNEKKLRKRLLDKVQGNLGITFFNSIIWAQFLIPTDYTYEIHSNFFENLWSVEQIYINWQKMLKIKFLDFA